MKSTGEVLGISGTLSNTVQGFVSGRFTMKHKGSVLFRCAMWTSRARQNCGQVRAARLDIYATAGTANVLNKNMIATNAVRKIDEPEPNIMTLLESGKIDYVISTCTHGRKPEEAGVRIRRKAVERHPLPYID